MNNKEEKIRSIGDELYNRAEHNDITNFQQWNEQMYELLDKEFPELERVGDLVADVETYIHDKHSFGFCDLCGAYINYDSDPWFDMNEANDEEFEWFEKSKEMWSNMYGDTAQEVIEDVCPMCFGDLTSERGFRSLKLYDGAGTTGGKSHEGETMGEFLDEAGIEATAPKDEISRALCECGLEPLTNDFTMEEK